MPILLRAFKNNPFSFKTCRKILLYFVLTVFILLLIPYLFYTVYRFPETSPFKGDFVYNPYSEVEDVKWLKANFHAHSRVWLGITNGSKNRINSLVKLYRGLGYDIVGISDYMRINKFLTNTDCYVPAYEHGYGWSKNHQIILGDENVNWFDYPLFQTINNKQDMYNRLKTPDNLVAVAHPSLGKTHELSDFKFYTNYDCIEVLRHDRVSVEYWDAALSYGHFTTLLAVDDVHDFNSPGELGRCFTMINSKSGSTKDILNALKQGNSYGVDYLKGDKSYEEKKNYLPKLAKPENITLTGNKIAFQFSKPFNRLVFIGQNSAIKKEVKDTLCADYDFTGNDTYIRVEVTFPEDIKYYFNPFIKLSLIHI